MNNDKAFTTYGAPTAAKKTPFPVVIEPVKRPSMKTGLPKA